MFKTDVIIIGGGQAGLAMSAELSMRQIDHIVLERGQIGQRWRTERWDSLQLLTPNWMTRLPGHTYLGSDPDGFTTRTGVIDLLENYSQTKSVPMSTDTRVEQVSIGQDGYQVATSRGAFVATGVVLATGYCDQASKPAFASSLPDRITQISPSTYRNPEQLKNGSVVIVGASATGLQLADEIQSSGRDVTLCVGRHTRMPRSYRGKDIMHWLDGSGMLDQRWTNVPDISAARRQPSLQLVGRNDRRDLNLAMLADRGVQIVGRCIGGSGEGLRLATDLSLNCARTNQKLDSVLDRIDQQIGSRGPRPEPITLACDRTSIDFKDQGVETIIWATGFKRDYTWLEVPVLDEHHELIHDGGVTPAPGLYAMGLQFMRRRKSSFIDGVAADACDISQHLNAYLTGEFKRAA